MHELFEHLLLNIKATWRYRWHAAAVAWALAIAGWVAVASLADRYQASSRVYVDTQSILRPLLAGLTMQPNINQIIEMMSRTLISRPNVEKVVDMAGISAKLKTPFEREATVTRLTKDVIIKGTGANNLYTITYADKDPELAKRIVQSLLTIFVEGSLGDKRKDTDSAQSFIDDQLKTYRDRLTEAENKVTEFKRRNMGLMPGSGQNFYSRLTDAQVALNQAKLDLKEAEQGRDAIKARYREEPPPSLLEDRDVPDAVIVPDVINTELEARIQTMQKKLDELRLAYTERHPDIVAILPVLERLKEQKQREKELRQLEIEQKQREAKAKRPASAVSQKVDPVNQQFIISMTEYEANVASLKARVAEYERRLGEIKSAANAIPRVEAEFTQLTRDYDVTKRNYDQLATRREAAQLTGDMQTTASVMDFRVIDPPQVATVPDWPNRPLLLSIVLLGSLVGGIACAFAISQLRPTINTERRLHEIGGLAVFGTVVMAWTDAQKRSQKNGLVAIMLCMLGLLIAYVAVIAAPIMQRVPNFETLFRLT